MALINSSPEVCQSRLEITIFILVGCLGYSNSAMNPILYAFLSDNFKKSFMKAFTCAKTKDVNAQLQQENSFFPRFGRGKNSEVSTSKPSAKLINNNPGLQNPLALVQSSKMGSTVESIIESSESGLTANNGHPQSKLNGSNSNNHSVLVPPYDEESDDDEQELHDKQPEDAICIINPVNGTSKPPVLHTDL